MEDIKGELLELRGWTVANTLTPLRSLFRTLKANRLIFTDPAARVAVLTPPHHVPLALDPGLKRGLLAQLDRPDRRLIVLLAGIHALSKAQIAGLRLEHLDLDRNRFFVKDQPRPLDPLTREHLDIWLAFRRARWPRTANPYVLVTPRSANNLSPVGQTYLTAVFRGLPATASELRIDRLVAEAVASRGDALRIARLFGMSIEAAAGYAVAFTALEDFAPPSGRKGTTCG
jgi:Site-specific recombinase XerC